MNETQKIESVLLAATQPMSRSALSKASGVAPINMPWSIGRLKTQYGDRLVISQSGKGNARPACYSIRNDDRAVGVSPSSKFALPIHLWRGWVNPLTRLVPERLGL